jgi:NAD+ kinase
MKINIISNPKKDSKEFEEELINKLDKKYDKETKNPDIAISIGGDGTFLYMIHRYGFNPKIKYAGFNLGTVGFLTSFCKDELDRFIDHLDKDFYVDNYAFLDIEIKNKSGLHKYKALNEIVLRNFINKSSRFEVFVNDEKLEDFVGDALMVSTPVGSSAYNYNLGGPLIYDKVDSLILNAIAPINNCSYKSINNAIWFDKNNSITVKPNKEYVIHFIIDGFDMTLKDVDYIKISLSKKKLEVLRFKKVSYSELIHNKLL